MQSIRFRSTRGEWGFLTNFSAYPVECMGQRWLTSEHAYQAQKFSGMNKEDYDAILAAPTAMAAAIVGRDPRRAMRADWDKVKDDVMRFVVMHKFLQNEDIKQKLLATGDACLIEHTRAGGDSYWGDGGDGSGKNMLGVVLMEIREILREEIEFRKETLNSSMTGPIDVYLASLEF